jgi:hypothetical protein
VSLTAAGVLHVQCTFREAEAKHARFLKKLPGICAWREALLAAARCQCCVTTLGGRRRYFRNLAAADSGAYMVTSYVLLSVRDVSASMRRLWRTQQAIPRPVVFCLGVLTCIEAAHLQAQEVLSLAGLLQDTCHTPLLQARVLRMSGRR